MQMHLLAMVRGKHATKAYYYAEADVMKRTMCDPLTAGYHDVCMHVCVVHCQLGGNRYKGRPLIACQCKGVEGVALSKMESHIYQKRGGRAHAGKACHLRATL